MKNVRSLATMMALGAAMLGVSGCHHNKVGNPLAHVDSKQPDKVLFDRAQDAIKHGRYDVGRNLLTTMINTYPDSEFVARAKLAIADSWYNEGNSASYAQAEREYKDFRTFFPNMPEAAEAQMRIADIHYNEMGKADRDYTQAKRAEDEYRQMIQDYPDHKLTPVAKQRLREVQEVLAEGQFRVAHFYYVRESWPAAIARLKTLADSYPLYSQADYSLFLLGQAYENEYRIMANPKLRLREEGRKRVLNEFRKNAIDAYSRIAERYPAGEYADAAAKRLTALEAPVPHATPEAIARNKQEIASRGTAGMRERMMLNFSHRPDVASAAKVGEPMMEDPRQESAPALTKRANSILNGLPAEGEAKVNAEVIDKDGAPADAQKGDATQAPATQPAQPNAASPSFEAVPENPNASTSASSTTINNGPTQPASPTTTATPPDANSATPVPQAQQATPPADSSSVATQATGQASNTAQPAPKTADRSTTSNNDSASKDDSSSSKTRKKKHKLLIF